MRNFKVTIEYDGTEFYGWQMQGGNRRTVQGEFESALAQIFKQRIVVHASGRTDSGVHALGQVVHFKADTRMAVGQILSALNARFPEDIVAHQVEEKPLAFHSRFNVKRKTYRYTILNRSTPSVLSRNQCLYVPQRLNLAAMRAEVKDLIGRKDFRGFMASDPSRVFNEGGKGTKRRISSARLRKSGEYIYFEVTADGFLYKMVRNIMGAVLGVGLGRIPKGSVKRALRLGERPKTPPVPARGLCLLTVIY